MERPVPGIYYVKGIINIPLQIVVTGEIREKGFYALKILTQNATEEDVRAFLSEAGVEGLIKGDRENIDAVLQVSVSANYGLYERIRREKTMCEALRELMKDEMQEELQRELERGMEKGLEKGKVTARFEDGMPLDKIAEKSNIPIEVFNRILKDAGMISD